MMQTVWRDIRIGLSIAGADVRDLIRRNDTRRQRAVIILLGLFILPLWLSFVQQAYIVGVETRTGTNTSVVAVARNILFPAMLIIAVFGGLGAAQSIARDAVRPLVLTSAPTRAIVIGKVVYLLATWLFAVVLMALPVIGYAVGARAPLFLLALVVGLTPLLLLTMATGLTLAYLLWLGIERLGLPETARRLVTASISVIAFLAAFAFGISFGRTTGDGSITLPTDDPLTPLGWYADVLFLGSPLAETPGFQTVVAVVIVLGALPLSFAILTRIAPAYWYATPAISADKPQKRDSAGQTPSESIGRMGGLTGSFQTLRVARCYARGAIRRPDQYVFLFYYLFPVAAVLVPVGLSFPEAIPATVGLSLLLLGVWFAGGVFCLNPLGTEGSMLSQLVLARVPAKTFIHARLVAGVALGLLLALVGSVFLIGGIAFAVGTYSVSMPALSASIVGGVLIAAVITTSACFALGLGAALPKFETTEVFDSVEALAPSVFAAVIHGMVTLVLLVGGMLVGIGLTPTLGPDIPVAAVFFGVVVFALTLWMLADGSRRYAIARFRDYGHERAAVDRPFTVYLAAGLGLFSLMLGQAIALGAVFILGISLPIEALLPILFVVEYLGAVIVAVGFLILTRRGLSYLDIRWPSVRDLGVLAVGLLGMFILWASASLVIEGLGLPAAEHSLFETDDGAPELLLILIPLVLLVNGPVEELLYRNVIQKYLAERFSTAVAIGITSIIFAVVHVPAYLGTNVFGLGVTLSLLFFLSCVLGLIYAYTRSLVVVSLVHGLYNATLLVVLYLTL